MRKVLAVVPLLAIVLATGCSNDTEQYQVDAARSACGQFGLAVRSASAIERITVHELLREQARAAALEAAIAAEAAQPDQELAKYMNLTSSHLTQLADAVGTPDKPLPDVPRFMSYVRDDVEAVKRVCETVGATLLYSLD
ncbi:hypothetical protein [Saccharopolyspora sp. NPDC002376]